MHNNTILRILSSTFILFLFISCNGQEERKENENSQNELVSLLQTDWEKYNLKGKIKEIVATIQRNYDMDTMQKKQISQFERNDIAFNFLPLGKFNFNHKGFVSKRHHRYKDSTGNPEIDWALREINIYKYDSLDYLRKRKITGLKSYPYNVYSPNRIKLSYIAINLFFKPIDTLHLYYQYNKKIEKGREYIKGEIKTYGIEENKSVPDTIYTEIKTINSYNEEGLITLQDVSYREALSKNFLPDQIMHLNMEVPAHSEIIYHYQYDDQKRITQVKLLVNGDKKWQEDYFYEDKSDKPYKLDKYIDKQRTYGQYFTENITEYYNEKGDIIKSVNFNPSGEVIRTRFYEYEYDPNGNWIKCDMYLEGYPEKTEQPTIEVKRKYEYY
ncbi:hypothetical protein [Mesonia aestuariivivens]|uniref:RHS repeat protein n=1 Tax=Mesonia aestuariivivens TaxID=2796128 RepID=A0ABS6W7M4_9FLAO|nr:hypothetical protein [Mesonia aestuariivivens]MBW2963119.1 hypothetical protein [Mesonia aestuariivivens]